jgi:hypothetical protein
MFRLPTTAITGLSFWSGTHTSEGSPRFSHPASLGAPRRHAPTLHAPAPHGIS